ncbi:Cysteine desulfurase [Candidatus Burkholderia humilis]|nr:Cysteine desulfurase [Candidatus Burkholderia humilis]
MYGNTIGYMSRQECSKRLHALLDPLREAGILSHERHAAIYSELVSFLDAVRGDGLSGEEYWEHFQNLFDFAGSSPRITPMNAANLCPEPRGLITVSNMLRVEYNRNVSQQIRTAGGERVQQLIAARKILAEGLGIKDPSDLAIIRNASEGNNAINAGYRKWSDASNVAEKNNVVLWEENHPTNLSAWRLRAEKFAHIDSPVALKAPRFNIRTVGFSAEASDEAIARAFIEQIDNHTRFVSYTEIANGSGFRIPEYVVNAIWNHVINNKLDCHVHIDGTMAWGARAVSLTDPPCHSFVSSAHKWFMGPKETGILFIRPEKAMSLAPSILGYDYQIQFKEPDELPRNAGRFELLGQRDDVNIISLTATQLMWNVMAPRDPASRVLELAAALKSKLLASGWTLITPNDPHRSGGVVRVHAPQGTRPKSLYNWLYEDASFRVAGSGDNQTFRLCPHVYNIIEDVDQAVANMNNWKDLG